MKEKITMAVSRRTRKRAPFFALAILLLLSCLNAQDTDPFYAKLLREGKGLFQEQKYEEAAETFEIAVFGLHSKKKLEAEANAYLTLCYSYLNDQRKSESYANKSAAWIVSNGIQSLDMESSLKADLEGILLRFKLISNEQAKFQTAKVFDKSYKGMKKELDRLVKKEPNNIQAYYDLYELHRQNNKIKDAKKSLEKLVKNNPHETSAYMSLAEINYQQGRFKDASKYYAQLLSLAEEIPIREDLILEVKVRLILCYYNAKNTKQIQRWLSRHLSDFNQDSVNALKLDTNDITLFWDIVESYKNQAQAISLDSRIEELRNAVKKTPKNSSLYYELYNLYRIKKDVKEAKKVLENLIKKVPGDLTGYYLLAKIEYLTENYEESLKRCGLLFETAMSLSPDNDFAVKAFLYTAACYQQLDEITKLEPVVKYLTENVPEAKLETMVKEENLTGVWKEITRRVRLI